MRKVGRWERLWVLVSGLLLVPAAFFASEFPPALSGIRHEDQFYSELSAEARAELARPGTGASEVTMPNGHVIVIQQNVYLSRSTPVIREYDRIITARLYRERAKFFAAVFFCWAAVCLVLYFLGWTVGRLRRRFK